MRPPVIISTETSRNCKKITQFQFQGVRGSGVCFRVITNVIGCYCYGKLGNRDVSGRTKLICLYD